MSKGSKSNTTLGCHCECTNSVDENTRLIPSSCFDEIMEILESELLKLVHPSSDLKLSSSALEVGTITNLVQSSETMNTIRDEIWCVGIFGSHVYGLAREDSDLDLFVIISNDLGDQIEEKQHSSNESLGKKEDYTYQFSASLSVGNVAPLNKNMDFTIYSEKLFKKLMQEYVLCAMEFVSILTREDLSKFVLLLKQNVNLEIQTPMSSISNQQENYLTQAKQLLRKSISYETDHSFVKAKNKITKERNIEKAMKALFHAFRTVVFGVQIAKFGLITDFAEANHYQSEIHKTFNSSCVQSLLLKSEEMGAYDKVWEIFKKEFKSKLNQLQSIFRKTLMDVK
ncbi:hypothetical protein FDP41_002277 [Naegleria fowleri]|uniref:Polymerase nucleotidyl transferase domain-containing protein n=1 Tax=Naegleria fowleri TaxID=5763 RepID=A0A6A5BN41_NAEFO|nr:uncharacterized protein FDP41_002277 [Naegleria fowleri]KAF0978457.1 hypothetical protein FDP41_002277 [Naegleria fowleri]CAG4715915.1 unnamed protein product [Naegleria fowleri]